jgi:hypothetical protein
LFKFRYVIVFILQHWVSTVPRDPIKLHSKLLNKNINCKIDISATLINNKRNEVMKFNEVQFFTFPSRIEISATPTKQKTLKEISQGTTYTLLKYQNKYMKKEEERR